MSGSPIAMVVSLEKQGLPKGSQKRLSTATIGLNEGVPSLKERDWAEQTQKAGNQSLRCRFPAEAILRYKQVVSWRLGSTLWCHRDAAGKQVLWQSPGCSWEIWARGPNWIIFVFISKEKLEGRETWIQGVKWGYWMRWSLKIVPAFFPARSLWAWLKEERF